MDWEEWKPIYKKILEEFGYEEEEDIKAAKIAGEMASSNISPAELRKIIHGRDVSICGAGENLVEEIDGIKGIIIAADEATSILLSHNILPHIITTDLDGNVGDILRANEMGSIVIIHAHGDNVETLKKYLPFFKGKIMLTTQAEPSGGVYNFGGFTDGDRAYCIASHFGAREIKLIGFDFENPSLKEGKDANIKRKKLQWAKKIIDYERVKN